MEEEEKASRVKEKVRVVVEEEKEQGQSGGQSREGGGREVGSK